MTTRIKFYVSNGSNVEGASVYCWFYNSNNSLYRCSGLTETQNNETCFVIESENAFNNSVYYIVHAYYNGASNIDSSHKTFVNGTNNIETIKLNNSNGYFFNLTSFSNFDTLFYYIGANQPVFPIKLIIANSNNTQITSVTLNNENSFTPITGYCNTQDIFLKTVPTGLTYNYFDSAITSLNIFGYIGGNISVNALTPKKQYEIEMPFVYDTAFYDNFNNTNIPCYNLPNTNIDLEFHTWNYTMEYEQTTNSNINSITIINTDVYSENVNNNWFYRCLAGNNISEYNSVKYKLSKNHYDDKQLSLTLSAYPLNDYENSCSTINHLYFCLNDTSVNPILLYSKEMNVITIDREKDAVFTRKELSDYVSGFDFYNDDLHKQSGLLLMFIDEFPTESELTRDGIDFEDFYNGYTPQEFDLYVDDYLDNPVLYGGNLYMYLRETFNYNGTNYYIWKLINDNNSSSDNVRYILTDTINYTTLYQQSLEYNLYNTYNTPVIVFLDSDRDYYMERHNYTEKIVKVMQANYDSFVLTPQNKATPSKTDFYKEVCSKFCGAEIDNLIDFKSTFVDFLRSGNEFITTYTKENYLESHYTDDNKHCYVLEETFYPVSGEGGNYLYFKNKCKSPQITGYENINTTVGVTLSKYGNPSNINIEYSFNYNPWRPYTIGTKIYLPKTGIIFFRAVDTNATFSIDADNFYIFDIDNTLTNDECNVSYDDLLGQYTLLQTNYDVIVGGKISSLLISTTSENAILNSFGFYDLFGNIKITDASELNLDLLSIPSYGYKYMFHSTEYLKKGPKIAATSVNEYSMDNMFEYSSLTGLSDNNLYFTLPASHCCYCMFAESNYNTNLNIASSDGNGSSHFENMFFKCKGSNASVTFQNMTTFNTDACRRMFYSANTTVFCTFSNTISNIGQTAFYEMYRYSRITSVNFTVTGSVFSQGCMYMCANLNSNSCYISNMHLDSDDLRSECYSHMFYYSKCANGTFSFNTPGTIPQSGCCNMFQHTGEINCEILPALKLSNYCYAWMFCDSDIKIAPELPAIGIYEECYKSMFQSSKITHHHNHKIHNTVIDFNIGSGDIVENDEYVLNATNLPSMCYSYMYAWSNLQYVSNIITPNLLVAGYRSCFHMFDGTPIKLTNRVRWLHNKSRNIDLTARDFRLESIFVDGNYNGSDFDLFDGDRFFHLYKDYYFNGNNSNIEVLTGMTIGGIGGDLYTVKESAENCNTVDVDGYFDKINNKDCFKLLTGKTGNNRFFKVKYGPTETGAEYLTASADRRKTMVIGKYPVYSYNESTAITNNEYSLRTKSEYVYLNATTVGEESYAYMYYNCYYIIPGHNFKFSNSNNLITSDTRSFSHMFSKCKQIRTITLDLNNIITAPYCFEYMYSECYDSVNENIFNMFNIEYLYQGLDYICTNIHTKYLYNDCKENGALTYHNYCENLYRDGNTHHFNLDGIYIKGNDMTTYNFSKAVSSHYTYHMFDSCYAIRYAKIGLPNNTLSDGCYQGMFTSCIQLVSGITISTGITTTQGYCFSQMFMGCTDYVGPINSLHKLTPTTMSNYAYSEMFEGCASLSASPYLPSTNMASNCYNKMFYSAFEFELDVEIETTLTIKRHSNGHEEDFTFYFCVSGTNDSMRTFWYFYGISPIIENGYLQCYFYTNSITDGYVLPNFTINGIQAKNLFWWNPDTEYFGSNTASVISSLITQLDNFLTNKYIYYHGNTGATRTGKIVSHTTPHANYGGSGTQYKVIGGLKVIKAQISKSNLETHNYTNNWVAGLDKVSGGKYYGPGYQAVTGTSTIPHGWSTYSS